MTDPYKPPTSNIIYRDQKKSSVFLRNSFLVIVGFLICALLIILPRIILDVAQEYYSVNLRPIKGMVFPLFFSFAMLYVRSKFDKDGKLFLILPIIVIVLSIFSIAISYIAIAIS